MSEEIKRIIINTGKEEGKYRVVGDLEARTCPRCGSQGFSSKMALKMWNGYCADCYAITEEEKGLGRKLTKVEQIILLFDIGLVDHDDLRRWVKQAIKKQDTPMVELFTKLLNKKEDD